MLNVLSVHRIWLGRSREMRELETGLDQLKSSRGAPFLITGRAGHRQDSPGGRSGPVGHRAGCVGPLGPSLGGRGGAGVVAPPGVENGLYVDYPLPECPA
jgi:hypothetical protein